MSTSPTALCNAGLTGLLIVVMGAALSAQVVQPPFNTNYALRSLGAVPGVPTPYGGLTFKYDDRDLLLIGGNANNGLGAIYAIRVTRDMHGRVNGFQGTATQLATAPNIDGGLQYGPSNVLFFTQYPLNQVGQIKAGSTSPDKLIQLSTVGYVGASPGALTFVPPGYPGAGAIKICAYSGGAFHDARVSPDGTGTFDITNVSLRAALPGGPEGLLYPPPGSPLLLDYATVILSNYSNGAIEVYDLDAAGDPLPGTRRVMVSGLGGAEGATVDASSGSFLFSTFGSGSQVIVIDGFGSCGTFTNYGTGIPNTMGVVPVLTGTGCATIRQAINFRVGNGPANALGALNIGTLRLNLPIFNGYVHTEAGIPIGHALDAQGTWSSAVNTPNDPVLVGVHIYLQAAYVDPGAPFGISASVGLDMLVL
ncbi:MAG: hypothetical protein IPM29_25150 [Planctomycetes bacterium]|nr:hypothetical protein [Planctomycetota bacterium]